MCAHSFVSLHRSLSLPPCDEDCRNFRNVNQVTGYFVNCMEINVWKRCMCAKCERLLATTTTKIYIVSVHWGADGKMFSFPTNPYSEFEANFRFSISLSISLARTLSINFSLCSRFLFFVGQMFCHFLGVTWCFGVWFFWILFAFIAVGQLVNFSIASTDGAGESERFSWCFVLLFLLWALRKCYTKLWK